MPILSYRVTSSDCAQDTWTLSDSAGMSIRPDWVCQHCDVQVGVEVRGHSHWILFIRDCGVMLIISVGSI